MEHEVADLAQLALLGRDRPDVPGLVAPGDPPAAQPRRAPAPRPRRRLVDGRARPRAGSRARLRGVATGGVRRPAHLLDRARHQAADQRDHQQQVDRGEPGRGEDVEELQPVEQRAERRVVGEVLGRPGAGSGSAAAAARRAARRAASRNSSTSAVRMLVSAAPGVAQQRPGRARRAAGSRPAARRWARWWSRVPITEHRGEAGDRHLQPASSPPHSPLTSSNPTATSRTPPPTWIARVCRRSQPSARTAREAPSAISTNGRPRPGAVGEGEHDAAQRAAAGARRDGDDARRAWARCTAPSPSPNTAPSSGAPQSPARGHPVQPALALQHRDQPDERQPHRDHDDPADALQHRSLSTSASASHTTPTRIAPNTTVNPATNSAAAPATRHRPARGAGPRRRCGRRVRPDEAGEVGQVAGHQRHHARRREAHRARQHGHGDRREQRAADREGGRGVHR